MFILSGKNTALTFVLFFILIMMLIVLFKKPIMEIADDVLKRNNRTAVVVILLVIGGLIYNHFAGLGGRLGLYLSLLCVCYIVALTIIEFIHFPKEKKHSFEWTVRLIVVILGLIALLGSGVVIVLSVLF